MTPLIKKLGLKEGSRACILAAPSNYLDLLGPLPGGVLLLEHPDDGLDFIQLFATEQRRLERQLSALKQRLAPAGMLWICWPKKASSLEFVGLIWQPLGDLHARRSTRRRCPGEYRLRI